MITRPILEAQRRLYREGQDKAIAAHARAEADLEKAKAELAAVAGAIDCCDNLLRILTQVEEAQRAEVEADKQTKKE